MLRKWYVWFAVFVSFCSVSFGSERPTLIITPGGVWQIDYVGDVPQTPRPVDFDVVVRGFNTGNTPDNPDIPVPPIDSPNVRSVAAISKTVLKDASEATQVYAIVEALKGSGLTGTEFSERLADFSGLIDTQIGASGRITKWVEQVIAATKAADGSVNSQDLLDGLKRAFSIDRTAVDIITAESAAAPGTAVSDKAIDFVKLIELIRLILDLIKSFKG